MAAEPMNISRLRGAVFRNSNAPQSCEQVGLYGRYVTIDLDVAEDESCDLSHWDVRSPAHINICLEEPSPKNFPNHFEIEESAMALADPPTNPKNLTAFLESVTSPLVVVGGLKAEAREPVAQFLMQLNAPVYFEAISGLRQDHRLRPFAITRHCKLWEKAESAGYKIDGILRIGGIPTFRLWRDLEDKQGKIGVYSVNDSPFSGLSWGPIDCAPLDQFFLHYSPRRFNRKSFEKWHEEDRIYNEKLHRLFLEEPEAEPSLIHTLSTKIPQQAFIYLGNSLPIREWDMGATWEERHYQVHATRGLNGIDGQTSAFLGLSSPQSENWSLLGDLTALHDLAGPWILNQMPDVKVTIAVINNGGGKIFEKMFPQKEIQNSHNLHFDSVANLWNLQYERWSFIPAQLSCERNRLIEITPNEEASKQFWNKLAEI